jgi:hypothetical protein
LPKRPSIFEKSSFAVIELPVLPVSEFPN